MNKIYKVIWNRVRHCYVVVSEIAKNHGKEHSTNLCVSKRFVALTLAIGLSLSSYAFVAAADPVNLDNGASAYYDDKGNLTIGDAKTVAEGKNQNGKNNTTIGTQTDTLRNVTEGDTKKEGQPLDDDSNTILVDGEGKAHTLNLSTEAGGSTAVGYQNKAEGDNSTAIGNNAKITNKPVTYYVDADGKKTASLENAVWYKDSSGNPTKVPQVFRDADGKTTTTPQYVHTYTEKDTATGKDVTKTEITSDATKADKKDGQPVYNYQKTDNTPYLYTVTLYQAASNSIAAGTNVTANGSNAVAVGYNSKADNSAVAIGDKAEAKENAVAMGKDTKATAEGSIALGKGSEADRSGGVTGWDPKTGTASTKSDVAWKSGEGALSIGNGGASRQITNVAAGSEDSDAVNLAQLKNAMTHYYSVKTTAETDAAGNNNYLNDGATGDNALAAGVGTTASSDDATAVGTYANATASQATAIGRSASASSYQDTAIGYNAGAHGTYATAVGSSASATSFQSTAIGYNAGAHGSYAIAMGNGASATNTNAIAIGASANVPYENSTAVGASAKATDNQATAIGSSAEASGTYATALGNSASATSYESTAIGSGAGAHGDYAIAMGNGASATNSYAVAIGAGANAPSYQATALGNGASATSSQATAIGTGAGARGSYATALGNGASAYSSYATALGSSATAQSSDDTAIGSSAKASGGDATALGYNAQATAPNATALGSGASAYYHAIAIGAASASSSYALAAGDGANAQEYQAIALGYNAKSNVTGGVALGSGAVADRKSGAKGYDMLTKGDTTNTSTAWVSNANAIAVGNGSTLTRQITGVAAGSQDTDAVNVAQLKAAGFKVTTQNNGNISSSILNGDTLDFEGKDNAIVSTSKDSKTITVAVSKTPTFDSATFYNPNPSEGQNNEKVNISNGHISTYNKDQMERAVLGTDNQGSGTLHLINNDLSQVHVYTQNSKEDGNDGITRMYYISSSGNGGEIQGIHTIAVLDDGINYAGDNVKPNTSDKVVVKHKLNSTMDIIGGADTNNLSDNNIGVVATPAEEDGQGNITQKGKLEIKLNKDVTGLNTVTAGTAKIGHTNAGTLKTIQNGAETGKYADAGDYVTGLTNKDWTTNNPTYVSGRAATEDELATVSGDMTTNANNITTNANNIQNNADTIAKGLSFTTNTQDATNTTDNYKGYKVVNRKLGDTIAIKASDADASRHYATTNLTTEIANNGDITIKMDESPTFNIVTAASVNLSPKDTTTKDQAGNTASARLDAHYRDASLNPDKNVTMANGSTGMVRLHYHDGEGTVHDLATMDDGQIYAGDIKGDGTLDTTGFGRKMNEKTTINGGVTDKDKLTDNNIGVVSNGTDTLTVKLAKNLKNLESVQAGKTTMNGNGLTIRKSDDDSSKNVVVLGDKVAFGDNQVNNMGSGASKITEDDKGNKTYEYNTLNNGANIGDVKNIASSTVQPVIDTVNKGWELDVNGKKQKAVTPDSPKVNLIQGQNITITGDAANTDNVTIATADDVRFNTVRVGGVKSGDTYSGGILIGTQSGKNADGTESANSNDGNYITGLENTSWDSEKIQHGRAATEDQLQAVATEIKNGTVKGDVFVTGGAVSYKGEGKGANPKAKDGTGSINLTRQNGTDVTIGGLHDYYVTGGTVTDDGKTLELTRNDVDGSGNP